MSTLNTQPYLNHKALCVCVHASVGVVCKRERDLLKFSLFQTSSTNRIGQGSLLIIQLMQLVDLSNS